MEALEAAADGPGAAVDRQQREQQIRSTIAARLQETGERERLEELLRTKLVECGWRDELKAFCKGKLGS